MLMLCSYISKVISYDIEKVIYERQDSRNYVYYQLRIKKKIDIKTISNPCSSFYHKKNKIKQK